MKTLLFTSPIDASNYVAGFGLAKGIALRRINYETGVYAFSLIREDDTIAEQTNGVNVAEPSEENAAADVRAAIATTLA